MLVPGVLFTPCLLSPLNNFLHLHSKLGSVSVLSAPSLESCKGTWEARQGDATQGAAMATVGPERGGACFRI